MRFEVHRAKALTRGADAEDAALFGTGRLSTLERVLRHAGARIGIDRVLLAETRLPAIDEAAPLDLGDLLAHHGLGADVIDRHATADVTDLQESVTLACDRHAALLVVTETARDAAGGIIAQRRIRVLGPAARFG